MVTPAPATIMRPAASPAPGPALPPGLARPPGPAMHAEKIGVAFAARTSTLEMQDPVASLRRQYRKTQDSLPPGFQIVACYWDIESGALDPADRSQSDTWQHVAAELGIPRDGGIAELLADAAGPYPRFAVVACEDISRVARDNLASLMVEKDLARAGIPIFAADEPASLEGASPTTILVRRIKQGTSEFYRLQMLGLCWDGLVQHAIDGWNIGPAPYGYLADRHQHPAALKAAQGMTRTRLVPDPERGPVITQIFDWRVNQRLSVPTITWQLNSDPAAYPPPGNAPGWTETSVTAILRNPKYTGYMVYGRTRAIPGAKPRRRGNKTKKPSRPVPPDQWIWSPQPVHEPLTSLETWQAAQKTGAERGNIRDSEKPTTQPGTRYTLRSRIRHAACQRRMHGIWRPARDGGRLIYYTCPYNPKNPRHAAACPDHPATRVSIREDVIMAGLTSFMDQYVFSHDRAAMLAATIPATHADHQAAREREQARLKADLDRIATAQAGLMTELERLGADTSPATQEYRQRIQARTAELRDDRIRTRTQLDDLAAADTPDQDPTLLDELPYLASQLADAPADLVEDLINALDIQVLSRPEQHQATVWATLTDTTPAAINALLAEPRVSTSQTTPQPSTPASIADLAHGPIDPQSLHGTRIFQDLFATARII